MKIFAITNSSENAVSGEFGHAESDLKTTGWRFLPDSSIFRAPNPYFFEEVTDEVAAFPVLAARIDRLGKSVAPRFSDRYIRHLALGVNIRNLTLEKHLREAGLPLDPAWGMDRSLLLSDWTEIDLKTDFYIEISAQLIREDDMSATGQSTIGTAYLSPLKPGDIATMLSIVSRTNTMKMGDIILLGAGNEGLNLKTGCDLEAGMRVRGTMIPKIRMKIPIR